jgi:tetratricopeptide (TPR) repeat protein
MGKEQTARGDLWEALRTLNRAVELDPRRATYYNARGYVYLRLQSYANAILEFSEAIRLRPDYANALRNRASARRHAGDANRAAADEQKAAELEKGH